jgi:ethanolamine utilization protein EutN
MRVCEVIGSVTLSRPHEALQPTRLLIVVPLSLAELKGAGSARAEEFVVWDELGAGIGSRVGVSEGREAAMPFHPERKPVDAYCACILDQIRLADHVM